ncbi:MAG: hypothetical protein AAGD04_01780 [Pseudomonadota bacterium]
MSRVVLILLCLSLAGCAGLRESRVNPLNWFGREDAEASVDVDSLPEKQRELRPLIESLTDVRLERLQGGAVLRVIGTTDRQGYYALALVPRETRSSFDTLIFDARGVPPRAATPRGTTRSREVIMAREFTLPDLRGIREIQVVSATNTRRIRVR